MRAARATVFRTGIVRVMRILSPDGLETRRAYSGVDRTGGERSSGGDDRGFVSLRCRQPGGRGSSRGSCGVQLLDLPALRCFVGLLSAGSGARFAPGSTHRRLHVERQDDRVPSLPNLRLCFALGPGGSRAQPHGRQRAPHGPGDPRRRPCSLNRWRQRLERRLANILRPETCGLLLLGRLSRHGMGHALHHFADQLGAGAKVEPRVAGPGSAVIGARG